MQEEKRKCTGVQGCNEGHGDKARWRQIICCCELQRELSKEPSSRDNLVYFADISAFGLINRYIIYIPVHQAGGLHYSKKLEHLINFPFKYHNNILNKHHPANANKSSCFFPYKLLALYCHSGSVQ